jgi:glycosyltransferase involved in cell wall biosynthesis
MLAGLGQDFALEVFCRGDCSPVPTRVVPRSFLADQVLTLPVIRRLRGWQHYFAERHFDRYVAARLRRTDVFQGATGQCAVSLAKAKALGCRTVLDVVTTHVDDGICQLTPEFAYFGLRPEFHPPQIARIRREFGLADLIRVMSPHAQATFLARGFDARRVVVAPPIIEVNDFPQAQFEAGTFRISFVGMLELVKGFHYLIEAFDGLPAPGAELVLWGAPGSRPINRFLQRHLAANPAIQLRPVSVRAVGYGAVYGRSHVLVLPSLADGFGLVVPEAMACGVPVIVSQNAGSSALVVDGENGFIVPPRDPGAIRERLLWLYEHRRRLREMGQAARQAASRLTLDNFREHYLPSLRALCR